MHYLILDSNIWLNALKVYDEDNQIIDALEYWINDGCIQILLPDVIIHEWTNNREGKKNELLKDWMAFVSKARDFFDRKLVNDTLNPDRIGKLVEEQLARVETIFRDKATIIPVTDDHRIKATYLAQKKQAPWGNKNSIGDALIYISMTEYIEAHDLTGCIFITENVTDFSQSEKNKSTIHPDLEPTFTRLRIDYHVYLNRFFHKYRSIFPDYRSALSVKEQAIEDEKLAQAVHHPKSLDNLDGFRESYIDNINSLDLILKSKSPTKEQVQFALQLLDNDMHYQEYFFKNVQGGVWFKVLSEKGFFDPNKNPAPIERPEGVEVPLWQPLAYLEKIAQDIGKGIETALSEPLLAFVQAVAESRKDNFRTWYYILRILAQLPNAAVSIEILQVIPIALQSRFGRDLISMALCESLLSKFLPDNPTADDIKKAEYILSILVEVEPLELQQSGSTVDERYFSRIALHDLKDSVANKAIGEKIAKFCSPNLLLTLSDHLQRLLIYAGRLEYTFRDEDRSIDIKVNVTEDLVISGKSSADDEFSELRRIEQYLQQPLDEFRKQLSDLLSSLGIDVPGSKHNQDGLRMMQLLLMNDVYTFMGEIDIASVDDEIRYGEGIKEIFILMLRNWLEAFATHQPGKAREIFMTLSTAAKYRFPLFRRMVFHIVTDHYPGLKEIFWQMIPTGDPHQYFSQSVFERDLRRLLIKNHALFNNADLIHLKNIIAQGPQDEEVSADEKQRMAWTQRWLRAIKGTQENQLTVSDINDTALQVRKEDLKQMSPVDIAAMLERLKSPDVWKEPGIGTIAKMIGECVAENPEPFTLSIDAFKDHGYVYIYFMLNGFRDGWQKGFELSWQPILKFIDEYITDKRYNTDEWKVPYDGWGANAEWVSGSIGELLSEGLRKDERGISEHLLQEVQSILSKLTPALEPKDNFERSNMDAPTYSLNSTAGKLLRALLDYSLKKGRLTRKKEEKVLWEEKDRMLFEGVLSKGIIDGYILLGMHFEQFYFLDPDWLLSQTDKTLTLDQKLWKAFIGGFAFGNPPQSIDVFQRLKPHYERMIREQLQLKGHREQAILRHFVAFYLWEFQDLSVGSLIYQLLETGSHQMIKGFLGYIFRQDQYLNTLTAEELVSIQKNALTLWQYLAEKYKSSAEKDEQDLLASLVHLMPFLPHLDAINTVLICTSISAASDRHYHDSLFEDLIRLSAIGNLLQTAEHLAAILASVSFDSYIHEPEQKQIYLLVEFLYVHDQKAVADQICNNVTRLHHTFLKELYNRYNNL